MTGTLTFIRLSALVSMLLGIQLKLFAQELPPIHLQEVEIRSVRLSAFAVGSSAQQIDSSLIALEQTASLADIIRNYTGAHIKSHGNGMLSSISFRGTGPEHTAVLWHGINIAYPMLGQSDFALLPIALNDQVVIQHGTGASLYGSGALGGTVALGMVKPAVGSGLRFAQYLGSFGTANTQLRASYANKKIYLNVAGFWNTSNNDFKFHNTTQLGEPVEEQQHASYEISGMALEAGITTSPKSEIQISGQYSNAHRNIQPSMNANTTDTQDDQNSRMRMAYHYMSNRTKAKLQYAFLQDVIAFNEEATRARQQVFRAEWEQQAARGLTLSAAADYTAIGIFSPFYQSDETREFRSNVWVSTMFSPLRQLLLSLNLRQGFHPVFSVPLTPSAGAEIVLYHNSRSTLQLNTLVAKGFRMPTLNELYWQPGGNLDLVPEESYSAEVGFAGTRSGSIELTYGITGYRMWVDNWIIWQPNGAFWSPQNIKQVDVYGLEASGTATHTIAALQLALTATYALTHSINRTGLDAFDRSVNKQLSYVPIHKGNITATGAWHNWQFMVNTDFTGRRYTTADNENALPAYILINLRASRTFTLNKYRFTGNISINNLLNTSYQSVVNKAMPGINFLAGVTFSFHKP